MPKQLTEMLKGTLEGVVLAVLARRPAYGCEITAWLREQGFTDIAEGTVYALLVRVEQRGMVDVQKVPSEKGPPRKVYSLNAVGRDHLTEFSRTDSNSSATKGIERWRRTCSNWSWATSRTRSSTGSTAPA